MIFQLIFVRRSSASFKVYVLEKHKICFPVFSGQFTGFKFGARSVSDVFVQNLLNRKSVVPFQNIKFFNNVVIDFIKFVGDARNSKILYFFQIKKSISGAP